MITAEDQHEVTKIIQGSSPRLPTLLKFEKRNHIQECPLLLFDVITVLLSTLKAALCIISGFFLPDGTVHSHMQHYRNDNENVTGILGKLKCLKPALLQKLQKNIYLHYLFWDRENNLQFQNLHQDLC